MNFIVYDNVLGSSTARNILRWGQAPAELISLQAVEPTETAIALPSFTPAETGGSDDGGYTYNELDETWAFISFPEPDPPAEGDPLAIVALARINAELRACDWTQLDDSLVTPAEQAQWAQFRADMRAVPAQPDFPASITWPTPPGSFEEITL